MLAKLLRLFASYRGIDGPRNRRRLCRQDPKPFRPRAARSTPCPPALGQAPTRWSTATATRTPVVALREIAGKALKPDELREEFIKSLQRHAEVDEPESGQPVEEVASDDMLHRQLTEEELLQRPYLGSYSAAPSRSLRTPPTTRNKDSSCPASLSRGSHNEPQAETADPADGPGRPRAGL